MAITVTHSKVSAIPDGTDTSVVRPSDWNATHTLVGVGTAASLDAGVANGVATLDSGGQVPLSQLPPLGDLNYQGAWNANTNSPTLTSSVGTKGYYYVVSVAGTTNLNGITDWQVGDWAVFNGSVWQKIDNTDAVTSVNGYTGAVVLTQTDISGTVPTSRTITAGTGLTGGGDLSANRTLAIATTGVSAATYGSASIVPVIAVNTQGQITSATNTTIAIANTQVSGLGTMSTQNANAVVVTGGTINGTTIGATTASTGAFIYLSTSGTTSTTPTLSFNGSNSNIASGATVSGSYLQNLLQNKSNTAGASTNYVLSNDLGTDSSYYGEFGMNSSVYSSGTPADFFSLNNGVYFSCHDGDVTVGSGNGYKTYFAWGTSGQSAHVINASGAIGLNTSITGSTNFGTNGQVLTSAGSGATPTWTTPTTGTVTSVTGTSPVVSSGGTTPAISMPAATTSVSGYLTSTDWNTFNGKQAAGTYVNSVSGTTGRITSTGGVTPVIDLASGVATAGTTGSSSLIPIVTIDTYGRVTSITTAANPQGTVTSVTGTAPVVSSGGATPAISMAAATASVNGYLTSTDWTTFNNKTSNTGTVTSVSGTGTVNGLTLTGTVTTTGNLTLGGTLDLSSPPAIGGTTAAAITGTTITATKFVGVSGGTF